MSKFIKLSSHYEEKTVYHVRVSNIHHYGPTNYDYTQVRVGGTNLGVVETSEQIDQMITAAEQESGAEPRTFLRLTPSLASKKSLGQIRVLPTAIQVYYSQVSQYDDEGDSLPVPIPTTIVRTSHGSHHVAETPEQLDALIESASLLINSPISGF